MEPGEFACPKCAEAIKIAAKVCRYCGEKFSEDTVERRVAIEAFIDERMERPGEITTSDLLMKPKTLENSDYSKPRIELLKKVGPENIEARAKERGIKILEPRRHPSELDIEELESLDADLRRAQDWDEVQEVCRRRRVQLRGGRLRWKEITGSSSSSISNQQQVSRDTQYGVLQPAANLAGGCVNMWIVLAIIVAFLIAIASLMG